MRKTENRDTLCIHAGYHPGNGEPRVMPVVQSTTYTYDSSETMGNLFDLKEDGFFYTRIGNPTPGCGRKENRCVGRRRWGPAHIFGAGSFHDVHPEYLPCR